MTTEARKSTTEKGRAGEAQAAAFLEQLGYRILQRNARSQDGELDLICYDGTTLVFVEVKARRDASFGPALGAVDRRKRAALRRVAADYAQIAAPGIPFRFDIVTIDKNRIALHRNAF